MLKVVMSKWSIMLVGAYCVVIVVAVIAAAAKLVFVLIV